MPAFNIKGHTPSQIADVTRVHRADHRAVWIELAQYVGELMKDHAALLLADEEWQVSVADNQGHILYQVGINVFKSPIAEERQHAGMPSNDR